MQKKWKIKKNPESKIKSSKFNLIIKNLLAQRGIQTEKEAEKFLNPDYEKDLHDPFLFWQMKKVIDRIQQALNKKEKVAVFGDHDVDGVSSAVLMIEVLEKLGLETEVYIPSKQTEGHGISQKVIDQFYDLGVTLMITVDCGMSNFAEVEYAKSKNIETIITDHHLAPEEIPQALAIINPKMSNSGYPFSGLCGVGVVFKVVQAIYQRFFPQEIDKLKWILDIVGVGTVADCMPLLDENRTIVKYSLIVLSKTQRTGFQEMINVCQIPFLTKIPTAEMVAFHIAPRLNALGRMSHAREAYDLLREKNSLKAIERAKDMEQKNLNRRKITEELVNEIEKIVEEDFFDKPFIFAVAEHYPVGIIGIVAGKIAEKYNKPTGIFSQSEKESRGSFRSINGVHILEAIKENSHLLLQFGGHVQAAGAVLNNENLESFQLGIQDSIKKQMIDFEKEIVSEVDLEIENHDEISLDLIREIKMFEPFGEANPEPKFLIRDLRLQEIRTVGSDAKHLKLKLVGKNSQKFDAIGFNLGERKNDLVVGDKIDIICLLDENEWLGNVSVQFKLVDLGKFEN